MQHSLILWICFNLYFEDYSLITIHISPSNRILTFKITPAIKDRRHLLRRHWKDSLSSGQSDFYIVKLHMAANLLYLQWIVFIFFVQRVPDKYDSWIRKYIKVKAEANMEGFFYKHYYCLFPPLGLRGRSYLYYQNGS